MEGLSICHAIQYSYSTTGTTDDDSVDHTTEGEMAQRTGRRHDPGKIEGDSTKGRSEMGIQRPMIHEIVKGAKGQSDSETSQSIILYGRFSAYSMLYSDTWPTARLGAFLGWLSPEVCFTY